MKRFTIRRLLLVTLYVAIACAIGVATGFPDWEYVWIGMTSNPHDHPPKNLAQGFSGVFGVVLWGIGLVVAIIGTPVLLLWTHFKLWHWSAYRDE